MCQRISCLHLVYPVTRSRKTRHEGFSLSSSVPRHTSSSCMLHTGHSPALLLLLFFCVQSFHQARLILSKVWLYVLRRASRGKNEAEAGPALQRGSSPAHPGLPDTMSSSIMLSYLIPKLGLLSLSICFRICIRRHLWLRIQGQNSRHGSSWVWRSDV